MSDLDGIRVRGALGGVDELVSETLGDRFHVAECRLAGLSTSTSLCEDEVYVQRITGMLTPMVRSAIDWFTLRRGDTSTA